MQFIKCRLESSKTCHLVLEKCVTSLLINPFKVNVPSHTETSQLICQAITFTGFYMMGEHKDIDEFKNMLKKVTMQHRKTNIVGNKAKRRISKQVFQENKASQIFRKINISCPLIDTRSKFRRRSILSICLYCYLAAHSQLWPMLGHKSH